MYSEKFLKTHKTVSESISYNVADPGCSKSTWALEALEHSRHLGAQALGHSDTWRELGKSGTRNTLALEALEARCLAGLWCNLFNRNLSSKVPNALRKSIKIPKTNLDHF